MSLGDVLDGKITEGSSRVHRKIKGGSGFGRLFLWMNTINRKELRYEYVF